MITWMEFAKLLRQMNSAQLVSEIFPLFLFDNSHDFVKRLGKGPANLKKRADHYQCEKTISRIFTFTCIAMFFSSWHRFRIKNTFLE